MIKKITLFTTLFFAIYLCNAQVAPEIEWQNTIGGNAYDELYSAAPTSDGGYILGGISTSGISGDKTEASLGGEDYWVVKLDSEGNIEWQNTIGGSASDKLYDLKQTPDGGYILGGTSISGVSGDKSENPVGFSYDYWVVKIDSLGNVEWDNTIGGNEHDWLQSIDNTSDGGYILGGYTSSGISGDKTEANLGDGTFDYWVVKLNSEGDIEWQNTIGGSDLDWLYSVRQVTDGGYILGGKSLSNASSEKTEDNLGMEFTTDYWVVKLDSLGNVVWDNTIGGNTADNLICIEQTSDGGYILGGHSGSGISGDKTEGALGFYNAWDYWIIKLDGDGDIEWQNTIWGYYYDYLTTISLTMDGGYIIGGYSSSDSSGDKTEDSQGDYDYWIVKLNNLGEIEWDNTIGGNTLDYLYVVEQTEDGGYFLGGYSLSEISGDKTEDVIGSTDFWVMKLLPPDCETSSFYADTDGDGYGNPLMEAISCVAPFGYVADHSDCNDENAFIHPLAVETCNGLDDNCNSLVDDGLPTYYYYYDADGDCYGDILNVLNTCLDAIPSNYVIDSSDCNDANEFIHEPIIYFADTDNDLYGDESNGEYFCEIFPPSGFVTNDLDCDDNNPYINPFSNEILNNLDDNCNGEIDEGLVSVNEVDVNGFQIFPNPNNGNFTIQIENSNSKNIDLQIINLLGEIIYAREYFQHSELNIHLPSSFSGIANVFIKTDSGFTSQLMHVVH